MRQIYKSGFQTFNGDQWVQKKDRWQTPVFLKSVALLTGFFLSFLTQAQTVDALIEKYRVAQGGADKLQGIQTLVIESVSFANTMEMPSTMTVSKGKGFRMDISTMGIPTSLAHTGETGWMMLAGVHTKPEKMTADYVKTLKDQLDPTLHLPGAVLLRYKEKGLKIELVGKEKTGGTETFHLKITGKENQREELWIDSATYLVTMYKLTQQANGKELSQIRTYSDYQEVDGIKFAYAEEIKNPSETQTITIRKIAINGEIDDTIFAFPDDVVATKSKTTTPEKSIKSGMDRQTADLIKASLDWQPIQKPDKTYDLKAEPVFTFQQVECAGGVVYSGAIDGTVIQGKCRIYYPHGYFEGIIEPLDLKTLVLGVSAAYSMVYHRYIPADRVQVISGQIFTCDHKELTKVAKGKLSAIQLYLKDLMANKDGFLNTKLVMNVYDDAAARVSWKQNYRNILFQADGRKDMIVDPVEKLTDGIIKLNYKASSESAKTRWLEKLNTVLGTPDLIMNKNGQKGWSPIATIQEPYEIADDNGRTLVLVPKSKNAEFRAYKAGIEEDYQLAQQQLARQKANAAIPKKQLDEAPAQLGMTLTEFTTFGNRMAAREDALAYVNVDKSKVSFSIPEIKHVNRVSTKGYPYYGKISLKLIDAADREVGSYDYVYDQKPATDLYSYYNSRRELKANVTNIESVNRYDVYCDGQKFTTVNYVRNRESTSYEGSFGGSLFEGLVGGLYDRAKVGGFEKQLLLEAELKGCYYQGNTETKTKAQAQVWFEKAQNSVKSKKYADAIEQLDAAIYADSNPAYYQLRADLFDRSNQLVNAFQDYLWLIRKANPTPAAKGELYRKMAYTLARIPYAMRVNTYELYADYAPVYLKKAAALGDAQAKTVLTKAQTSEEQLQLLRATY